MKCHLCSRPATTVYSWTVKRGIQLRCDECDKLHRLYAYKAPLNSPEGREMIAKETRKQLEGKRR